MTVHTLTPIPVSRPRSPTLLVAPLLTGTLQQRSCNLGLYVVMLLVTWERELGELGEAMASMAGTNINTFETKGGEREQASGDSNRGRHR